MKTILCWNDERYPLRAREPADAPPMLYYKGNIKKMDQTVGIVGARRCSQEAKQETVFLASEYAKTRIAALKISGDIPKSEAERNRTFLRIQLQLFQAQVRSSQQNFPPLSGLRCRTSSRNRGRMDKRPSYERLNTIRSYHRKSRQSNDCRDRTIGNRRNGFRHTDARRCGPPASPD